MTEAWPEAASHGILVGDAVRISGSLMVPCAALALAACAGNPHQLSRHYLDRFAAPDPTPASFFECHGFGCAEKSHVSLSRHEWRQVAAVFAPRAVDAKAERQRIARAVALMQRLVGAKTGTAVHQWTHKDMMIRPNFGDPSQLDCVDEAVNTWTYLTMMQRTRLFRFHQVADLAFAGSPTDPNPRNAAVLRDKHGQYFAIDPSLVDSGVPPPVMPLATWLGSWPPDLPAHGAHVAS